MDLVRFVELLTDVSLTESDWWTKVNDMTTSTICAENIESAMSAIAIGNEDQGRQRVRTRVENMQTPKSTIINGFGAVYLETNEE